MDGRALPISDLTTTLIIGLAALVLLYWYGTRNYSYWKKKGVPYVKPQLFFGSMLEYFKEPLHDVEQKWRNQLGTVFGYFEGSEPRLSVGDPILLRNILVQDFSSLPNRRDHRTGNKIFDSMLVFLQGEDWRRVRKIITPTFSSGKLKRIIEVFRECSKTLIRSLELAAESGKAVDVQLLYEGYILDANTSFAFSTKIDSINDPTNEFVIQSKNFFVKGFSWPRVFFALVPGLKKLMMLLGVPLVNKDSVEFLENVTLQIIEQRKRTGETRNDFLQLLIDTAKEVDAEEKNPDGEDYASNYGAETDNSVFKNTASKNLTTNELIAQCIIFLVAGFETTVSGLSLATYLLALNQDIQDKLRDEVDTELQKTNGELTHQSLQNMKYLDNVISESMRLYPPIRRLDRIAEEDYRLGDTGIVIPKDMVVTFPIYAVHRDPELYPDPERFDPDRFNVEERRIREQYAYLPFGGGPRNCIGLRFAHMEIKVCLALMVANFIIKRSSQTKVPPQFPKTLQGTLQCTDVTLEMEIRKDRRLTK